MYPAGLFGYDWLRILISPIAVFGIVFFTFYLRNEGVRAGRAIALQLLIGLVALTATENAAAISLLGSCGWHEVPTNSTRRGFARRIAATDGDH